jgi:predicted ATPase
MGRGHHQQAGQPAPANVAYNLINSIRSRLEIPWKDVCKQLSYGKRCEINLNKRGIGPNNAALIASIVGLFRQGPLEQQCTAVEAAHLMDLTRPDAWTIDDYGRVLSVFDRAELLAALEEHAPAFAAHLSGAAQRHDQTRHGAARSGGVPSPKEAQLIGREAILRRLANTLSQPDRQLLTVVGTGGVGKTQLALHLASRINHLFSGCYFADLAAFRQPEQMLAAIAHSVLPQSAGRYGANRSLLDILVDTLYDRPALLVLDNLEQLLRDSGSQAEIRRIIQALLDRCSQLKVLITSRQPLNLPGELPYNLKPLTIDAATTELDSIPAVLLFVKRARQKDLDFAPEPEHLASIAAICRRLDGIPLAIELAAARVRHTGIPISLIARLEALGADMEATGDQPARQQTMRATIAWSYDLLSREEQTLFKRLAVFVGPWSLAAAAAVCFEGRSSADHVLNALARLVDKSLIQPQPGRGDQAWYSLYEMLREYGLEQLAGDQATAIRQRHANYYLELAETLGNAIRGERRKEVLAALEDAHLNMGQAMAWLIDQREYELAGRLGAALAHFWSVRGYAREEYATLATILNAGAGQMSPGLVGAVRFAAGWIADTLGNYANAQIHYDECHTLRAQLNDRPGLAYLLYAQGRLARSRGNFTEAEGYLSACLGLVDSTTDPWLTAAALGIQGFVQTWLSRPDAAERSLKQSYQLVKQLVRDPDLEAAVLTNLGNLCARQGEYHSARDYLEQAKTIYSQLGNWAEAAICLNNLVATTSDQGHTEDAFAYLDELFPLLRELGHKVRLVYWHLNRGELLIKEQRLEEARRDSQRGLTLADDCGDWMLMGFALDSLACIQALEGLCDQAAQLLGAADSCYDTSMTRPYEPLRQLAGQLLDQLLEPSAQAALRQSGRLVSVQRALELSSARSG